MAAVVDQLLRLGFHLAPAIRETVLADAGELDQHQMVKRLTVIGNSLRPILDLLRPDKDTPLEQSTDGKTLIVRPAAKGHKKRVEAATERLTTAHDETLRKLAT
jgi:hypothetical protein